MVRNAKVPPIGQQNPEVEPEFEEIVRKALARRVEDRFQSATDLQDALAHYWFSRGLKMIQRDIADLVRACQDEQSTASTSGRVKSPTSSTPSCTRSWTRSPQSVSTDKAVHLAPRPGGRSHRPRSTAPRAGSSTRIVVAGNRLADPPHRRAARRASGSRHRCGYGRCRASASLPVAGLPPTGAAGPARGADPAFSAPEARRGTGSERQFPVLRLSPRACPILRSPSTAAARMRFRPRKGCSSA